MLCTQPVRPADAVNVYHFAWNLQHSVGGVIPCSYKL